MLKTFIESLGNRYEMKRIETKIPTWDSINCLCVLLKSQVDEMHKLDIWMWGQNLKKKKWNQHIYTTLIIKFKGKSLPFQTIMCFFSHFSIYILRPLNVKTFTYLKYWKCNFFFLENKSRKKNNVMWQHGSFIERQTTWSKLSKYSDNI